MSVDVNNHRIYDKYIGENETDEELLEGLRSMYKNNEEQIKKSLDSYKMMRDLNGGYLCFDGHLTPQELIEETKDHINWPEDFA